MTGIKDTNNAIGDDELIKKMLFGRSSKFYKSLYEIGLLNY